VVTVRTPYGERRALLDDEVNEDVRATFDKATHTLTLALTRATRGGELGDVEGSDTTGECSSTLWCENEEVLEDVSHDEPDHWWINFRIRPTGVQGMGAEGRTCTVR